MLVCCAMYSDVIKPLSLLSLALQNEIAHIVTSIETMLKSANALTLMAEQSPRLDNGEACEEVNCTK